VDRPFDPEIFAAGVWNLTPAQAHELNAHLDCEPSESAKLKVAARYIFQRVDSETLARDAARIRSGELRIPLAASDSQGMLRLLGSSDRRDAAREPAVDDLDLRPLPTVVVDGMAAGTPALEVHSRDGRRIAIVFTTLTGVAIQTAEPQELAFQIETEDCPPRIHVTLADCLNPAVWARLKRQQNATKREQLQPEPGEGPVQ
jgi:hypothetical protein